MNSFLYPQWFSIPESGALLFLKSNILSTQYALLSWKTNVHEFCSIFSLTITSHSDFLECILIDCSIFWIYNTFKKKLSDSDFFYVFPTLPHIYGTVNDDDGKDCFKTLFL